MYIQPLARGRPDFQLARSNTGFRSGDAAPLAEELLTRGLAYGSGTGGVINMTAAGRLWLNQRAE